MKINDLQYVNKGLYNLILKIFDITEKTFLIPNKSICWIENKTDIDKYVEENMNDCFKYLPQQYSDVLRLYYFCGFSHKKIGDLIGMSTGRVINILNKSIDKLREERLQKVLLCGTDAVKSELMAKNINTLSIDEFLFIYPLKDAENANTVLWYLHKEGIWKISDVKIKTVADFLSYLPSPLWLLLKESLINADIKLELKGQDNEKFGNIPFPELTLNDLVSFGFLDSNLLTAINVLRRNGYNQIKEFLYLSDKELLKIKGLGKKSAQAIRQFILTNECECKSN